MYHNIQLLSIRNIDSLHSSSIITRITNDVVQVQEFINGIIWIMVKASITCISAIILILIQTLRQMPVMVRILVVFSIHIFGNMRIGYSRFETVQRRSDRLNGVTQEFLSSIHVVKAFNGGKRRGKV